MDADLFEDLKKFFETHHHLWSEEFAMFFLERLTLEGGS